METNICEISWQWIYFHQVVVRFWEVLGLRLYQVEQECLLAPLVDTERGSIPTLLET
jgi:hypothetical protein